MKTTIDIADGLLSAARQRAHDEKTTLRALVERGLDAVLRDGPPDGRGAFEPVTRVLEPLPGVVAYDWESIREDIYGA